MERERSARGPGYDCVVTKFLQNYGGVSDVETSPEHDKYDKTILQLRWRIANFLKIIMPIKQYISDS